MYIWICVLFNVLNLTFLELYVFNFENFFLINKYCNVMVLAVKDSLSIYRCDGFGVVIWIES
jgi:hypothetical protein